MAEKLFFGYQNSSPSNSWGSNAHHIGKFQSAYTGKISKVGVYSLASGNMKMNLYDVVSGVATNLLWADDTGVSATSGQYNYVSISGGVSVSAGTLYGIGINGDTDGVLSADATATSTGRTLKNGLPYSTFTAPDPTSGYTNETSSTYSYVLVAYGYEPPTISTIDKEKKIDGEIVTLTGLDFMPSNAIVEVCNNAVYGSATIKLSQTVTSQTDSEIQFTLDNNDQLWGLNYIFVTTDLGQITATPMQINIGRTAYFFVTNNFGLRNAIGFPKVIFE